MTIKQHGGVFGRNPSFNDVTIEGDITLDGATIPDPSTILVDGDIGSTVQGYDADTAKLDAAQTFTAAQTFNENIVMANTKGIDFSATAGTGTSELFDDYEEGEWTPVVSDAASGGNTASGSFSGHYTKVGDLVTCVFGLFNINTSGMTAGNDLHIQGLPFVAASLTGTNRFQGALGAGGGVTFSGTLTLEVADSQDYARILETDSGSTDYLIVSELNSGTADIYASITYKAA